MPQRISISRWSIGETSQRAIGDYDQPIWPATCRLLTNFVPSETGKLWRRPGFVHNLTLTQSELQTGDMRLVPYYRNEDTLLFLFYLEASYPDQELYVQVYEQGSDGLYEYNQNFWLYTFKAEDFEDDRPTAVDLKKLSWVQVDNFIYVTHENMEDPRSIEYVSGSPYSFNVRNYSAQDAYYWDVVYEGTEKVWDRTASKLTDGGGESTGDPAVAGWTPYTGKEFTGEDNWITADPQTFKYLVSVNFAFERLVFTQSSRVFGTQTGNVLIIGRQDNGDTPATVETEAVKIIPSDPFFYRAASDLGYEKFYWTCAGSMLMGGANNGAWVLSNREAGGIDPTNPLMYKATTHGAHWVGGKTIGDSMLYFQRPGRLLKEFLYVNANKNYVAANMSEYSDHLYYDYVPVEMQVQRSPFNVLWQLREDGVLTSFTYERQREVYAWARHPFKAELNPNDVDVSARSVHNNEITAEAGKVITMAIVSNGIDDQVAIISERENADGKYRALEVMARYTPDDIKEPFVDAATAQFLSGTWPVTSITPDPGAGHKIFYDNPNGDHPAVDMVLNFPDAKRTPDEIEPISEGHYDYILGGWTVEEVNTTEKWFRIKTHTGLMYEGIHLSYPPDDEYAYLRFGTATQVIKQPIPGDNRYTHLSGVFCECIVDGSPKSFYVSEDGSTFYNSDLIPRDWDGDESSLVDEQKNNDYFSSIIIGRSYDSVFSPFVMKKQLNRGKINGIELELFRSLGGKVGTANVGYDNVLDVIKAYDLTYPANLRENELYTGTVKPSIVGGYGVDPFFFVLVSSAVPFNITNSIFIVEAT